MITLVDYGIGNLRSLEKAFAAVDVPVLRTDRPEAVLNAERLVVPGVGAFGACVETLRARGLEAPLLQAVRQGTPLLGVCVGMQMLFETSEEMGTYAGLGLLPGHVARFEPDMEVEEDDGTGTLVRRRLKVPHVGWSPLTEVADSPLLEGITPGTHFYFVHSYRAVPEQPSDVLGWAHYGVDYPVIVGRNRVFGVQFHPEKSQHAGLRILRNFAHLAL